MKQCFLLVMLIELGLLNCRTSYVIPDKHMEELIINDLIQKTRWLWHGNDATFSFFIWWGNEILYITQKSVQKALPRIWPLHMLICENTVYIRLSRKVINGKKFNIPARRRLPGKLLGTLLYLLT